MMRILLKLLLILATLAAIALHVGLVFVGRAMASLGGSRSGSPSLMGYWFDAAPWILVATALLGIVPVRWYVRAVGVPFIIAVLAAGAYLAGRNQLLAIGYFLYAAVWLANFIIEVVAATLGAGGRVGSAIGGGAGTAV